MARRAANDNSPTQAAKLAARERLREALAASIAIKGVAQ
jgi:hypothetical protein